MEPEPASHGGLPLAARMALVIGGFGLLGSAALVWWVLVNEAALSRQRFLDEGRSNAAFIARTGLPASEQMARQLGEVLGLQVHFRRADGAFVPPVPVHAAWMTSAAQADSNTVVSRGGWERLALPLESGDELWLVRPVKPAWHGLLRPGAMAGL